MWRVLMRTGELCPNAHSELILSLSSAKTFTDAFTVFPMGTGWLGCHNSSAWGSWLWLGIFRFFVLFIEAAF
jgi:hypothetical protein